MILDYNHDYMNHMMDWSPNGWFLLIVGGLIFVLFIIIIIYILSRVTNDESYIVKVPNKMESQKTYKVDPIKITGEKTDKIINFCPTCGEKLDGTLEKFCPFCGSKT